MLIKNPGPVNFHSFLQLKDSWKSHFNREERDKRTHIVVVRHGDLPVVGLDGSLACALHGDKDRLTLLWATVFIKRGPSLSDGPACEFPQNPRSSTIRSKVKGL